jgi:tetratricopeptide (TPR) repeat protein
VALLQEAVAAERAALEVRKRDQDAAEWAGTAENLGDALERLGDRQGDVALLREAIAMDRASLDIQTRDRAPFWWAEAEQSLGNALERLGEHEGEAAQVDAAVAAYNAALNVYVAAGADHYITTCRNDRDRALAFLTARKH